MIVGIIKHCSRCGKDSYIKTGVYKCPNCDEIFNEHPVNKAPMGWVKMEDYEISRRSVEKMLQAGDLTLEDLK